MKTLILTDARFLEHDAGIGHPESPARLRAILSDLERAPPADVVFLRNVLIYFDEATKAEVLARVAGAMRPGGYLILGSAETIRTVDKRYERVQTDRTVCYRLLERTDP